MLFPSGKELKRDVHFSVCGGRETVLGGGGGRGVRGSGRCGTSTGTVVLARFSGLGHETRSSFPVIVIAGPGW